MSEQFRSIAKLKSQSMRMKDNSAFFTLHGWAHDGSYTIVSLRLDLRSRMWTVANLFESPWEKQRHLAQIADQDPPSGCQVKHHVEMIDPKCLALAMGQLVTEAR